MKALLEEEGEKLAIEEEIENQRHMTKTTTPMTAELFAEWKRKKAEAQEVEQTTKRAERVRTDKMSGRELFLSDASLFVDDAEAYDSYVWEEELDEVGASRSRQQAEFCDDAGVLRYLKTRGTVCEELCWRPECFLEANTALLRSPHKIIFNGFF